MRPYLYASRSPWLAIVLMLMGASAVAQTGTTLDAAAYQRSALFLPWNKSHLVVNDELQWGWIGKTETLWYRRVTQRGWRYLTATPANGQRREAFNHDRMASVLGMAANATIGADRLPITAIDSDESASGGLQITALGRFFHCDAELRACVPRTPADVANQVRGPGGKFAVFRKGANLGSVTLATGKERELTTDGVEHYGYGSSAEAGFAVSKARMHMPDPPDGVFSNDGTQFLSYRLDMRRVPQRSLIQSIGDTADAQPRTVEYRAPFPGDSHGVAELWIFNLADGASVKVLHPPVAVWFRGPYALDTVRWSPDGRHFYFVDYDDLFQTRSLLQVDAASGKTVTLIADKANIGQFPVFVPQYQLLGNGDILWSSERTGWQQLYRFDSKGTLRNPVTRGAWVLREILDVDESRGTVTFSAGGREAGRDPYLRHVYRAGLDGSALILLTPENADHQVRERRWQALGASARADIPSAFSSSRRFFVDAYSRVDLPTVTVVRGTDGRLVMALETATHPAGAPAYSLPERFTALAADGVTPIFGVLFKPANFDGSRRYPVIDVIYGGPQVAFVPSRYGTELAGHYGRGLTELGFVVTVIDGRGTPLRSSAFQSAGYGKLGKAGFIEDHVAALRQLGSDRTWMDLSRVGAFGYSGGGFAVVHALLDHPDFYKVGVAVSPYDPMLTDWAWGAQFQGPYAPDKYLEQSSYHNAAQLRGKLLLVTGDMDDVAPSAGTMRIANALIQANKTFDMLVVPNGDHQITIQPYVVKRQWDYFVQHLLHMEPPADFVYPPPGAP